MACQGRLSSFDRVPQQNHVLPTALWGCLRSLRNRKDGVAWRLGAFLLSLWPVHQWLGSCCWICTSQSKSYELGYYGFDVRRPVICSTAGQKSFLYQRTGFTSITFCREFQGRQTAL